MLQIMECQNNTDANGNPAGGFVSAEGLRIVWQDGPLGRGRDRQEPNGAFVETVLAAVQQRIEFYEEAMDGKFSCDENAIALRHVKEALRALDARTKRREVEGTEGTHTPDNKPEPDPVVEGFIKGVEDGRA